MLKYLKFQTVCFFFTCPIASIKVSWIVHKNVWVYCVAFLCAKKQSFLLLQVWWASVPFFFFSFFFMMNLEDLFPLPALTHCDLSTVSSPLKRKRKRRKNPASIKAHSLALDVKQTCKSVIHMQAGWTLFRGFFFFSWEIHSGTHVWNPYLPSQETCLFVSFLDGVWWCL